MTYVLGISAFYHDSAACLLRDGRVIAAAQEERFSRKKHDSAFPVNAVKYCLSEARIAADAIDAVAFYEKPWLKFERLLETYLRFAPRGLRSWLTSMPTWLNDRLWLEGIIREELYYSGPIYYPRHHESHAASAFFPSPFDRAAILTIDGVGEWSSATWGIGNGVKIDLRAEMRFPHSIGLLYSAFTSYLGFRINSGEYKVMGLAPYGAPTYVDRIQESLMDLKSDGSFRLNMRYFNYCTGLTMTNRAFDELFGGPPRKPESAIDQRHLDIAASIQEVTNDIVTRMAQHVQHVTGETQLCMAGGVALNCVANSQALRESGFEEVWVQPAAGDSGGALGAAQFVWYMALNANGSRVQREPMDPFLGPSYSTTDVASWADLLGYRYHRLESDQLLETVAELIDAGNVVGWFSGRMEFGPRALGARSILADARNPEIHRTLNLRIKHRESFRPFAPACLEEDAPDYFDLTQPSPFMLFVADVNPARRVTRSANDAARVRLEEAGQTRSDIPAVTHVDYSARVQTVGRDAHPRFRALLEKFKARSGCSVMVNTSLNVRGEPIVCTPAEAYNCMMATSMDALVIEDVLFYKNEQGTAYKVSKTEFLD